MRLDILNHKGIYRLKVEHSLYSKTIKTIDENIIRQHFTKGEIK